MARDTNPPDRIPPGPIPLELLADLQAGLLDDATAARLRRRLRYDPEASAGLAALERVRRDLAGLFGATGTGAETSADPGSDSRAETGSGGGPGAAAHPVSTGAPEPAPPLPADSPPTPAEVVVRALRG